MNPRVPDILSRVLGAAERTLHAPTGDIRRLDEIEQIFEDVSAAMEWATDQPRRYVNEWTQLLVKQLRMLERLGPHGDAEEIKRAKSVGLAIVPYVQGDALKAMHAAAGRTSDHDFKNKTAGREP